MACSGESSFGRNEAARNLVRPPGDRPARAGVGDSLMVSPTRISHVVLQTNRIPELRDWYCAMLGASVVYEDSNISFISFDDEHHRVAFINPGPVALREGAGGDPLCAGKDTGLHHFAFTFARLADLVESYERNKSRGVLPYWCVNHG